MKKRPIFSSLMDEMEVMGVPLTTFKVIMGFTGILYLITRNFMCFVIAWLLMIACRLVCFSDMYKIDLLFKHLKEEDKLDA
ncbi:MAG: VirB3 family type IV secretion system protein [Leptotrichiaceae bacterium]|nr:VirB3 family type IV secretion system protein [Leptotrichiaceae bacterium]